MLKKLLSPTVIVPIVLTVGVIAALLVFSDVKTIIRLVTRFPLGNLIWFFVITLIYEVVRCAQWNYLLRALRIEAPLRSQIYAFVLNEFSRNLPVGGYFQNYLLQQSTGADFGRTSAATTLILASEVALCLLGVVVLGLGAWSAEVRIIIVVAAVILALLVWTYEHWRHSSRTPTWIKEHEILRKIAVEVRRFREGAGVLLHPRILVIQGLLGVAYLLLASAGLYLVALGLDPHNTIIDFPQAIAIYLFTLATAAIFPVPEVGGVGAFLAYGVSRNVAVGAMLLNRVLSIIASIVSVVAVTAVMPGELRAILKARRRPPVAREPEASSSTV